MLKSILFSSTLILSSHVGAAIATGYDLANGLNSEDPARRYIAAGYIVGAFDSGQHVLHCAPNMLPSKLIEFVKSGLDSSSDENLRKPGDFFINVPLSVVYPCKDSNI